MCRQCGGRVAYGNLVCSAGCGAVAEKERATIEAALHAAGFLRDDAIPNIYRKDGVAVTVEHVTHVGMDRALAQHAAAAAKHA